MREIKSAELRKNEILDSASTLFFTKGYEQTSTNDILEDVGIARGTLYYHFKSKEDILNSLLERELSALLLQGEAIAQDKNIPVIDRLFLIAKGLNFNQHDSEQMLDLMHQPENVLLHHRMNILLMQRAPKIFAHLIQEGVDEGIFKTDYPLETMEMVILYLITYFGKEENLSAIEISHKVEGFIHNFEKLLGAKTGSLAFLSQLFNL